MGNGTTANKNLPRKNHTIQMRKLVITVVITFLAFIGALPQTNADDSQSEKTRYWKPTQGDCCGENCNVVYSYYGDSLPKIGINQEFSYFEFIQYASRPCKILHLYQSSLHYAQPW